MLSVVNLKLFLSNSFFSQLKILKVYKNIKI